MLRIGGLALRTKSGAIGLRRTAYQEDSLRYAGIVCLIMGSICSQIAAAHRECQGDPTCDHRYRHRLHQCSAHPPRLSSDGVRKIPPKPAWAAVVLLDPEGGKPSRCQIAKPDGANTVVVAQELCELDREARLEMGVGGLGSVCYGHKLKDKLVASSHVLVG